MRNLISFILLILLLSSCSKDDQLVPANSGSAEMKASGLTVTTASATFITSRTATSGGEVSSSGGGNTVSEKGICYGTGHNPTTSNTKVVGGSGAGAFTCILSGLSGSTLYYIRAYAIKSGATTYGNEVSFTTLTNYGSVTDADGNTYNTITIGSQVWTMENLKTTKYRDGTSIPNVTDDASWGALTTGAYCSYNNDDANVASYGRLYNWYAVNDSRNLAPAGWHVPSYDEWYTTLINSIGGCNAAGKKLKDNTLWNGDNSSGFGALPAGSRYSGDGPSGPLTYFSGISYYGEWWTSSTSASDSSLARYKELDVNDLGCSMHGVYYNLNYSKRTGYSIRLVKD